MRCPACDHDNIPGDDLCAGCGLDLAGLDVQAWGVTPQDPLLTMPLDDLPLKDPLALGVDDSVTDAIRLMKDRHEGCVFILEEEQLVGVVTDRDIALRALAEARDPETTPVLEIATTPAVSLREELPLSQASDRMRTHGLRRVPVIDAKGRLVGMVAVDDLGPR